MSAPLLGFNAVSLAKLRQRRSALLNLFLATLIDGSISPEASMRAISSVNSMLERDLLIASSRDSWTLDEIVAGRS